MTRITVKRISWARQVPVFKEKVGIVMTPQNLKGVKSVSRMNVNRRLDVFGSDNKLSGWWR